MENKHISDLATRQNRPNIDLNQFQQAIAAADYGSFRRAADALAIKQSTLSRSIQSLEHILGIAIFHRSRRGVRATPVGRHFLRVARSILEQVDTLLTTTRASGRGEAGRLVVGFCTSLTVGNLRASLLDFGKKFPQVEVGTVERSKTRLAIALRNGAVDACIMTGDTPFDCKATPLWSERILIVLPSDHTLTQREVIHWTDLCNQNLLLSQYDPGLEFEALLNGKLHAVSDRPRIEHHDVSRGVIKSLISMGLGISLVLESDMGANFSGLVYRELRDGTGSSHIVFSAVWREDNENPVLANFLRLLSERYPFLPET